jgi:hypothetical protein
MVAGTETETVTETTGDLYLQLNGCAISNMLESRWITIVNESSLKKEASHTEEACFAANGGGDHDRSML